MPPCLPFGQVRVVLVDQRVYIYIYIWMKCVFLTFFFRMKTVFPSNVLFWMTTEIWQHLCGSTSTHEADHLATHGGWLRRRVMQSQMDQSGGYHRFQIIKERGTWGCKQQERESRCITTFLFFFESRKNNFITLD